MDKRCLTWTNLNVGDDVIKNNLLISLKNSVQFKIEKLDIKEKKSTENWPTNFDQKKKCFFLN